MNSSRSTPDPQMDRDATAWLARIDRGLTAGEQDAFFIWLAANPQHGDVFAEHSATQRRLHLLAQWRPEHGAQPNPDLLAPSAHRRSAGATGGRAQPPSGRHFHGSAGFGWMAAAAAVVVGVGLHSWNSRIQPPRVAVEQRAMGEQPRRMLLNDGSTIDLGPDARVAIHFSLTERRVRLLQGAAHFAVAPNPRRPFFVETEGAAVRAVGTAFDVHLQPGTVEVLVTAGTVAVSARTGPEVRVAAPDGPGPRTAVAGAGHRVTLATDAGDHAAPAVVAFEPHDRNRLVVARNAGPRQLEFDDVPLASVVAELNRDNRVRIVIADPALAALPVGAVLQSDNVDGFVRLLEQSFRVVVERSEDNTIVLRGKR